MIIKAERFPEPLNPNVSDLRSAKFTKFRKGILVGWLRVLLLLMVDVGSISLAWLAAAFYGTPIDSSWNVLSHPSALVTVLTINISLLATAGLYRDRSQRGNYLDLIKALSLATFLLLAISFLQNPNQYVSRSTFLLSWLFTVGFTSIGRGAFDLGTEMIRKRGVICYPVFVISDEPYRERDLRLITAENRYRIVGVTSAKALDLNQREQTFQELKRLGVAEVFISWEAIKNRLHLCWHFQQMGISLWLLSSSSAATFFKGELSLLGDVPTFRVRAPELIGGDYWIKRCFDFFFALILLIVLLPVNLLIAILIKVDSRGPIFFKQERVGLSGKTFKVWKFRTMVAHADKLQATLEATNEMKDGVLFKMKDDPRVTRIGKILRAYSLDELPQLINVLIGEMSFVGPRPLPIRDVKRFKQRYFIRQEVLPGITGLWQVSGRSDIDNFEEAVNLDFTYITNWSLWLDLVIMFRTVMVILNRAGAY